MSKRFKSQDYFRYKKLGKRWRRPTGLQSKLRVKKGGSGMKVSIGYGSPGKPVPTLIFSEKDFEKDCTNGVLIGSSVGSKKTVVLTAKAKELGLTILNMKKAKRASRLSAALKKKKELESKDKEEKSKKEKSGAKKAGKKMGFHEDVVPQVFEGKTKTYRLRDHNLHIGDEVALENSQKGGVFGHARITNIEHIAIGKINLKDAAHYKVYDNTSELIDALKRHYPDKTVTPETDVFVYTYEFTPVKSAEKINDEIK